VQTWPLPAKAQGHLCFLFEQLLALNPRADEHDGATLMIVDD